MHPSKIPDDDVQKINTSDPKDKPTEEDMVQKKVYEYYQSI